MNISRKFKSGLIAAGIAATGLMGAQSAVALNVTAEVYQESKNPWGMAFLKDGTFFFTEKCDGLSVRLPSGRVNKLLGIGGAKDYPAVKNDLFCDGQAGMLGVEIDPEFDKNGFIYVRSTSKGANRKFDGYANILMRMKVNSAKNGVTDIVEIINDMGLENPITHLAAQAPTTAVLLNSVLTASCM